MIQTESPNAASRPNALIIRTAGINCDEELAHALTLAGASPAFLHLNTLMNEPERFNEFDIVTFPGGFSYGDDVAGGAIFAMHVRQRLYAPLRKCIDRGIPMFAVCNGFQVLAKVGLLPGPMIGETWPTDAPPKQSVSLTSNSCGHFIDDWVGIEANPASHCVWTRNLAGQDSTMMLPIAHGEGRFVAAPETIDEIESSNLVALRYTDTGNVNGSMNRIAGICDSSGLIFGLMPHPERYVTWQHHPFWTRLDRSMMSDHEPLGLQIFRNAVEHAASNAVRA